MPLAFFFFFREREDSGEITAQHGVYLATFRPGG
jgi:hypothetical protein